LEASKIDPEPVEQRRGWRHSGFSVDDRVRHAVGDTAPLYRLVQYPPTPPSV
jgi:hypothetical protein